MGKTVARHRGDGEALWVLGGLYEVKASTEETGGAMTVMEMTLPDGMGPPPHTHPGAEAVYVLDGTVRYHIGDDVVEGRTGSFFHVTAGTVEHFEPVGTARILVIYSPGHHIDEFFARVGEPAAQREVPPTPEGPPDLARIVAVAAEYGMQIQLPPEAGTATPESIDDAVIHAWDTGNTDAFLSLLADQFVWNDDTVPEPMTTLEAARAYTEAWFTAFPDMRVTRTNRVCAGSQVAAELTFTGTNSGTLAMGGQEIPATEQHVDGRGSYFMRVENGKIVEAHTHPDVAGMMAQLGLIGG